MTEKLTVWKQELLQDVWTSVFTTQRFTRRNVKVFLGFRTLHNILAPSTETFGNILKTKGTDRLETWPKHMCQGHLFALWELKWVVRILLCLALAGETCRMWAESLSLHRCEDLTELRITSQCKWWYMVSRNSEDPPCFKNSLQHCCNLYLYANTSLTHTHTYTHIHAHIYMHTHTHIWSHFLKIL